MMKTSCLAALPLLLALGGIVPPPVTAQDGEVDREVNLDLSAHVTRAHLLTPDVSEINRSVPIDDTPNATFVFGSASKTLHISLTAPTGETYTIDQAETPMVHGFLFPNPLEEPDATGANYVFDLTDPVPGTWSYTIREPNGLTSSRAVLATFVSSSPVRTGILGGGREYCADREVVLALVTANEDEVLRDLHVEATIERLDDLSVPEQPLSFVDDGSGQDSSAGDGLFTASVLPGAPGEYRVTATVRPAITAGGPSFERTAVAVFTVHPVFASLDSTFTDRGIDRDGDGLLDTIELSLGVDVTKAGLYNAVAILRSAAGATVRSSATATLPAGSTALAVPFEADRVRESLGADGPYELAEARLEALDPDPDVSADYAFDLGLTAAYRLDQLERPPILLLPGGFAEGIDANGNGTFDFLDVTFPVELLFSGTYRWSARLVDGAGEEITLASNLAFITRGTAELDLRFDGRAIGEHGVDGPYRIKSLIVFGAGESIIVSDALETPAFLATDFEGFDQEPPEITVTVTPSTLWPVNHKLVEIAVDLRVSDNVDPNPEVRLESITSNQGENHIGDGNTSPDIIVDSNERLFLRAERAGPSDDRIYTLTWSARDFAGNQVFESVEVTVPHDQRGATPE